MELLILILLTIVNGLLALSELAVVSARKVRLSQMAGEGSHGAQRALELVESPNRFLSTVQIGITLVSILQGAFAGATLARPIAALFARIPFLAPESEALGLVVVVALTTYVSLVVGELVPKRLAMQNPERMAAIVAPAMHRLSVITTPFVKLLSVSTDLLLRLLGVRHTDDPPVTADEILALMRQGVQAGVFEKTESEMVAAIMSLDDRRVDQLMTPRTEIEWIDLDEPLEKNLALITNSRHARFPAGRGTLDNVVGVIRTKDLLKRSLNGQPVDLHASTREALFIPESALASHALELFRQSNNHIALVISEYGGIEGLITLNNLVGQIIGDVEKPAGTQRPDGSWLLDGLLPTDELKTIFDLKALPGEQEGHYQTLGGFVMAQLGHIPRAVDQFEWDGLRFEVMDMDGKRVDKVLVTRLPHAETDNSANEA
jgi:putative hemolysin